VCLLAASHGVNDFSQSVKSWLKSLLAFYVKDAGNSGRVAVGGAVKSWGQWKLLKKRNVLGVRIAAIKCFKSILINHEMTNDAVVKMHLRSRCPFWKSRGTMPSLPGVPVSCNDGTLFGASITQSWVSYFEPVRSASFYSGQRVDAEVEGLVSNNGRFSTIVRIYSGKETFLAFTSGQKKHVSPK